jgi:hypothetical protein
MAQLQVAQTSRFEGEVKTGDCSLWIEHDDTSPFGVRRVRPWNTDPFATARITLRNSAQGHEDSFDTPPTTDSGFINVPASRQYFWDKNWEMSAGYLS